MSYINYKNVYTIDNSLNYNLFTNDLNEFKKLITDDNYTKSIYRNEINDISFIQFNNVNNEDVLDVDSGIIENIGTQKINLRVYKYFIIDFKRFVTINEVSIYDQSYNIIPYTLWTRSKENGDEDAIFDTSSVKVTSMAFNHLKKVAFEIENVDNFPNYIYYRPIKTDKIFYYPIDIDVSFISYYTRNDFYQPYYENDFTGFYKNTDNSYYLYNRTPTMVESVNIINNIGPTLYGDSVDDFYTLEGINNHLYNNTKIEFDRLFFDVSAVTQLDESYNYNIVFLYNNYYDSADEIYDTSRIYIDLSSDIFRLFNISDVSSTSIALKDRTINTLDLSLNTEISFNFVYNPYESAEFLVGSTLNGYYQSVGFTGTIIDKYPLSDTTDLSCTHVLNYSIPIILYDTKYVLVKENAYSKLISYDSSSVYLSSTNLNTHKITTNDLCCNTITSTNIDIVDLKVTNELNLHDLTIDKNITTVNAEITNVKSLNSNLYSKFNLDHHAYFNVNYPYKITSNKENTHIIKIYNDDFINYNYNTDYLELNKNVYSDKLIFNTVFSNKIFYKLNDIDASFTNVDVTNIVSNRSISIEKGIKSYTDHSIDLAYYDSDNYGGYKMNISSYKTGLYDCGWNIELNNSTNLNCKNLSYIRLYPLESNIPDNFTSVFEIESYYLRHNSTLNWIKNIDSKDISNVQYLSNIVYKDGDNSVKLEDFDNLSLRPNNIVNYPNLSIVNKLQPKLFYRDPSMSTVQAGFIAQDLQEITDLSFLVYSNYHNYKKEREKLFVNYDGIQPYLIASLQEIYFILEKMAEHNDFSYTYNSS